MKYITNCPNCGAPITQYGKCAYCGTIIHQPLQMLITRPGVHKLVAQTQLPYYLGETEPEAAAQYAKNMIKDQMAEALTDSIKFVTKREFDPCRFEEIITVRGELWITDPNINY